MPGVARQSLTHILILGALVALGVVGCSRRGAPPARPTPHTVADVRPAAAPLPIRAVWVARMHYHYADDIATIMRNCAHLGINTVLFQVRGDATVSYPSELEPWSREYGHRDPGFDPLAIAVREAHANKLRIHAWINVMPGWSGSKPPAIRSQLHYAHPEWFLHDAREHRQPLGSGYVILNPCLPEVREYITAVCGEIAANYAIDGLHLDYVRYAWETAPDAKQRYPRDSRTLALYRDETGQTPEDDPAAWDRWRAAQLTRLVGQIGLTLRRHLPDAELSAAVVRDPAAAYARYLQDSESWLRSGLVDVVMPMAYTAQIAEFSRDIDSYGAVASGARIVPGLGIYKAQQPDQIQAQLEYCRSRGGDFALFSYASLHATAADRARLPIPANVAEARDMRRAVLREFVVGAE